MSEYQMTEQRWANTGAYLRAVFGPREDRTEELMARAAAAGLPRIDVGPECGRMLQTLAAAATGGGTGDGRAGGGLIIEVGTLAGSSAIWLARGLKEGGGRVITIDVSDAHLAVARREVALAGVAERVEFRHGRGSEVLPAMVRELGPGKVDMLFLDAERSEYVPLLPTAAALLRPGGVLAIDNALAAKRWVADPYEPGESMDVMDTVNRAVAADASWASSQIVPLGNGLLVAVRG